MTNSDDDEWEYEYSSTETESFYIPLDLSNVPSAQIPPAVVGRPGHPTLLKSRLRALNAQRGQPIELPTTVSEGQEVPTMGELQIIGLHTPNPLVMYNGQLLSCDWNATLGTDMFFAKPEKSADTESMPLRSLPEVDLIALSSAKLVARVATLRPRDEVLDAVGDDQIANESVNTPASATGGETGGPPASFLERLNQAKAKRGDKTPLIVYKTSEGSRLVADKGRGGRRGVRGGRGARGGTGESSSQQPGDIVMGGT